MTSIWITHMYFSATRNASQGSTIGIVVSHFVRSIPTSVTVLRGLWSVVIDEVTNIEKSSTIVCRLSTESTGDLCFSCRLCDSFNSSFSDTLFTGTIEVFTFFGKI